MPTYDFHCEGCDVTFSVDLTVKEHDAGHVKCPKCGSEQVKQLVTGFFAKTSRKS